MRPLHGVDVLLALLLVVSLSGDSAGRTAAHAFAARAPLGKEEAVCVGVVIGPWRGRDGKARDDRAAAHGLADRGDEAVAQAEGAETCCVGRMPLRPGRSEAISLRHLHAKRRKVLRGQGLITRVTQPGDQVIPELYVELFPKLP